jgi:hypothetical protein
MAAAVPSLISTYGPAVLSAAGSIGGSLLGNMGKKETKTERIKRKLIDELMSSLNGEGKYSDIFNKNEEAFQKSYVDPAMSRFKNQIAPQIQQSFIAGGNQGDSALEDALTRAGVDLNEMLNSQQMNFMQQGDANKMSAFNSILGGAGGVAPQQSFSDKAGQAVGGYFSSDAFQNSIDELFKKEPVKNIAKQYEPFVRQGFEGFQSVNYGDKPRGY